MKNHNNFPSPFRKKKFQITFETKNELQELIKNYNQLEEIYSEIYSLTQDFTYKLESLDLDYNLSHPVFVDISVEIPWLVTTDFISQMKDITNLNDIDEYFEIKQNHVIIINKVVNFKSTNRPNF